MYTYICTYIYIYTYICIYIYVCIYIYIYHIERARESKKEEKRARARDMYTNVPYVYTHLHICGVNLGLTPAPALGLTQYLPT